MANFTGADVAELRKITGVGILECRNALTETDGDKEKAVVLLREKGLASQAKKATKVAAEGIAKAFTDIEKGVAVAAEVNIQTDFAAKNPEFVAFVDNVIATVAEKNPADVDELLAETAVGSDKTVKEVLENVFIKIQENIQIRRFVRLEGLVASYTHGGGSIGVLVKVDTDIADKAAVIAVAKDVAMQVAALSAPYLSVEDVPATVVEQEKAIARVQIAEDPSMANKPAQVIENNIIPGKIKAFYKESVLLEQVFVKDNAYTVGAYVAAKAKELGGNITITEYVRLERGEGIEKKEDDFAAEVAKMAGN